MKYATFHPAAEPAAMLPIDELPLPYLEIDAWGVVIRANRAALALHPPEQGELVGQLVFSILAGEDREPTFQVFLASMDSCENEAGAGIRYIYDRSGKYARYQVYHSVIRDAAGNLAGMRILCVGVSETVQALEEAHSRSLWLEAVLDSIHDAVIATDATGVILSVNSSTEKLLGWKAAELVGKAFEDGIQLRNFHDGDRSPIGFAMVLASRCNGLATLANRHGHEIVVRIWASPILYKESGAVSGVVLLMYRPGAPMIVPGLDSSLL
jgi:PAS domain S-box-containing protein